jgi:hypothetical protein
LSSAARPEAKLEKNTAQDRADKNGLRNLAAVVEITGFVS